MFGRSAQTIAAIGTALLALALPGSAAAEGVCDASPPPATWPAFAAFDDPADYFLAPGGDFEPGGAEWTLSNAAVVDGNEDVGVLAGDGSLALGLGLLGSSLAVSPPFCVTSEHPAFRYLFKVNGLVGQLSTFVRYRDRDGQLQEEEVHSRTVTTLLPGQWQVSELQPLATEIPLDDYDGTAVVQLVFRTALDLAGGYQVDNVLVDPYRTR